MFELEEEEEVFGTPTFEVLMQDGQLVASGSYFMVPPRYLHSARWSEDNPHHLLVTADDGSRWEATGVPHTGKMNIVLHQADR
jgi:hypothetical protein